MQDDTDPKLDSDEDSKSNEIDDKDLEESKEDIAYRDELYVIVFQPLPTSTNRTQLGQVSPYRLCPRRCSGDSCNHRDERQWKLEKRKEGGEDKKLDGSILVVRQRFTEKMMPDETIVDIRGRKLASIMRNIYHDAEGANFSGEVVSVRLRRALQCDSVAYP